MNFIFLLFILFNCIYNVCGFCTKSFNYNFLGTLTNTTTTTEVCENDMDICIYTTFNVPGYAIGIISGCQKSVEKYLSNIINERKDLANIFHNFINSTSNKIDIPSLCKYTFEIKPFIMFETLTGKSEFFIHCYLQNIIYISPPTSFYPPSSPVIPVTCSDGVKKTICYEGYCGMMEVGYISQSNLSQINITYQSCPNDLVNKVYEISQINDLISNKDFQSKTEDACSHCIAKSSTRILSNSETFSYYLYTNCYDPNIGSIPVLPPFPSLNNQPMSGDTTTSISMTSVTISEESKYTTEKISTTTKNSSSNVYLTFSLSFFLFFFYFF